MTLRKLEYTGSAQHKLFYKLTFEAFRSRGSAEPNQQISKAERRTESKILRALKAISDPIGEEPKDGEPDLRMRALHDFGGSLTLEQPEFSRLQKFIDETKWQSLVSDVEVDLEDWFDAAEKVDAA